MRMYTRAAGCVQRCMKNFHKLLTIFGALLMATCPFTILTGAQTPQSVPNGLPSWAYNIPDKNQPPTKPITGPVHVPGSSKEYEGAKIAGNGNPPDWFPNEHPPAPAIVTGAGGVTMMACGSCHLMSGQGHPESADIAGMPVDYLVRQMGDFKTGVRKDPDRMGPIAKATSDEDVRAAAEYFAAIKPIHWVTVIETTAPPKTYVATAGRHRLLSPEGGTEPMGNRIVEIPKDPFLTTIRDPHSSFIAYVPLGSIERGERLVKTGGDGETVQCGLCHGSDLKGTKTVPRLAGLQPVYIARQLIYMQNGARAGSGAAAMKKAVENLTENDVIAISAYLGSLPPQ